MKHIKDKNWLAVNLRKLGRYEQISCPPIATGFLPHLTLKLIGIQFRKIGIYEFASEYSLGYDFSHLILLKCRLIYIHKLISWIFQLVEWISREIQVCFFFYSREPFPIVPFFTILIKKINSLRLPFLVSRFPFGSS